MPVRACRADGCGPKPSYVADWDDLPAWQQPTDADIFERIERSLLR